MKWFFWGIVALALFLVIRNLDASGVNKPISENQSDFSSVTINDDEQELRAENFRLREEIVQLNKEITQLKHSASGLTSSQQPIGALRTDNNPVDPLIFQEKVQRFNDFLASENSIASLKASFANEEVDSSWATNYQRELEAFFKNSFTEVFPQYIECRSKRCKITVPAPDQKKFSKLSQELIQHTLNNNEGIAKKIVIEPTENDGTLNFYLARNDEVDFLQ